VNGVGKAALGKVEDITRAILVLRGRRVLLHAESAVLYGVTTRRLNEQVRRNRKRFPDDFLFELTTGEFANLKSRFATSSWGGRRKRPLAFTEYGAIQAATILNSPRAVEMSVYVVRAFVKLREVLSTNRGLARRFEQLESRLDGNLTEHDEAIAAIPLGNPRTHAATRPAAPRHRFHRQAGRR
jgi:hypothetical protein